MYITNLICTAYVATGHLCADGHLPKEGFTCAGPRNIPLGTHIYIESIGERTITDRTRKKYNGRIDIFIRDKKKALIFGKRKLKITIYERTLP